MFSFLLTYSIVLIKIKLFAVKEISIYKESSTNLQKYYGT